MNKESIEKYCKFCEKGRTLSDDKVMLCDKYGMVRSSHCCRHFIYDPLKRAPKVPNVDVEMEQVEI